MTLAHDLASRCAVDPEFALCARHWTGRLIFDLGEDEGRDTVVVLDLVDGVPSAGDTAANAQGTATVTVSAPSDVWTKLLAPVPPPYFNDIIPAQAFGLRISGSRETAWQYHAAIRRAVDLLRERQREH